MTVPLISEQRKMSGQKPELCPRVDWFIRMSSAVHFGGQTRGHTVTMTRRLTGKTPDC